MAAKAATLTVQILTDASKTSKGTKEALSSYQKFEKGVNSLVPAAAVTVGAITAVGAAAVNSASRTEQAFGGLESVFGSNAGTVKDWANNAAQSVGLAASEYAEAAAGIGAQLNNMGLSSEDALSGTKDLISLGADLAATFGGSTSEAVDALSSALRGEADPAERYGLSLSATSVNAALAAKGLDKLKGDALKTAKTQTILELATDQAGGAIGQFGRESDTAAGQTQRMQAETENAASSIGTALLPIVAAVAEQLAGFARWVGENSRLVLTLGAILGGLAAGLLLVSGALKAVAIAQQIATVATRLWNAALKANPIGILITLVVALVATIVYLWNTNEGFRNFFISAWNTIKSVAAGVWNAIKSAGAAVFAWLTKAFAAIGKFAASIWKGIQSAISGVFSWLRAAASTIRAVVVGVWTGIGNVARSAWNGIRSAISSVFSWIRTAIAVVRVVVTAVWTSVRSAASAAWSGVRNSVRSVLDWIRAAIANVKAVVNRVWNAIGAAGKSVWNALKSVARGALNAILAPVRAVKSAFDAVVRAVQNVISWLGRIKIPDVFGAIGDLFSAAPAGVMAVAPQTPAARGVGAPRVAGSVTRSSGVTININGGLDSAETIARRVQSLLTDSSRRRSGVVLTRRTV